MRYNDMRIKVIILALLAVQAVKAQTYGTQSPEIPVKQTSFQNGEKLTYLLGWELKGIMNASAGEVVFRTTLTTIGNTPAYRIYANGRTLPSLRFIYDLDDTYETWLDISTLRPVKFRAELKENKYRYQAEYNYDWERMEVHTTYRNLKRPHANTMTMQLTDNSADAVAFFFNLRSEDIGEFGEGEGRTFDFVMDDEIRQIRFKYIGREQKKIGRLGTFKTLKLSCELASNAEGDGQTFESGTELFIWLSDDQNRIPLYIESPTKIGKVVATISKYEGLKYPLSSKIK